MSKNQALSEFLTSRRAAVTPEMAGIQAAGPRRVPGLRREEVAVLAGVSADWYSRLEQGRQVTPSESVLAAIARVLQLDDAERDYLFNLSRPAPGIRAASTVASVRPGIIRMMRSLDNQPAFVLGPRMEVLAGNELAWALLADFPAREAGDRNLLRWIITGDDVRELYLDWESIATDLVGVLQLEASANPGDQDIAALVAELSQASPQFATWWTQPRPQGRTSGVKRFNHPTVGALRIDWEAFGVPDDSTQTLFVYTGSEAADEETMRLLASWRATVLAQSPGA